MRVRRLRKFVKPRTGELITFESKQYYVTDEGQVYDGNRHRYVAQHEVRGYQVVNLFDDEGSHNTGVYVHCLVASCFIRLLEKGENCHHLNHNRQDNNLSNLEIIDGGEHARQHNFEKWGKGTYEGVGKKVAAKLSKPVVQLDKDDRLVRVWPSTMEAARNGYNFGNVAACCRNCYNRPGNNVYKGFRWQWYVKEKEK